MPPAKTQIVPTTGLLPLHALFFASGALGLAYEVLWMRLFTPLFGGTTLAAAATLSAFFLGSSLGSWMLGTRAARWQRPGRTFGWLEIGVGLGALLVPMILRGYVPLYASLAPSLSGSPLELAGLKLLLTMVAVALPTFCMGGTLPALAELVASGRSRLGVPVGGLYAIHLAGAACGALAVPFLLLPGLGVLGSQVALVAGSLTIGLAALALYGRTARSALAASVPYTDRSAATETATGLGRATLWLAAGSGAVTLGLQVLWTRMFSLVHENSLYSFTVVVVVFLIGLAGGAALARTTLRRGTPAARVLGWAWGLGGLGMLAAPRLFERLTNGLEYLPASLTHLGLVALLLMLPACLALGAALPALMEVSGGRQGTGVRLGRLLAANTAGAILGPLLATFVLGPWLGLWSSLVTLGGLTLLAGTAVGQFTRREALILVLIAGGLGAWWRPHTVAAVRVRSAQGERLVSVREDSYGTTAVLEDARDRWITVNNSYVLGGAAATGEQRWQGHLPLLLHPQPRQVAFLGLGTAITASAALLHPAQHIVALEIVPSVVAAARVDFADFNGRVLDDPRVEVVADDGRSHLAAAHAEFDVVVGDLLVPWRPAEAALYTREHFVSVRRALRPGGVFCQWLPLYQLSERQAASLVATFVDVFPNATLWRGNFLPETPTLGLVGWRDDSATLDVEGIDRRSASLAARIDEHNPLLKHPAGLWILLVGAVQAEAKALVNQPRNTDATPWVELWSARGDPLMAGASVVPWLETIRTPTERTPGLAGLDPTHADWLEQGRALAEASAVRGPQGEARVLALLKRLPSELQHALGLLP